MARLIHRLPYAKYPTDSRKPPIHTWPSKCRALVGRPLERPQIMSLLERWICMYHRPLSWVAENGFDVGQANALRTRDSLQLSGLQWSANVILGCWELTQGGGEVANSKKWVRCKLVVQYISWSPILGINTRVHERRRSWQVWLRHNTVTTNYLFAVQMGSVDRLPVQELLCSFCIEYSGRIGF